jgi:murein DD-endopeptidase MepM/ murein hydrolase activator NlpD
MHRLLCLALLLPPAALADDKAAPGDWPVLFEDDFGKGAGRWQPTDPAAWKVIDTGKGHAYSQFAQSNYKPPHRSPFNFALVRDLVVGDFALEARVRSTARDYPHRDVCLVFGYQDPAHFYYAHLGKQTDDHANQVFIVNDAPRSKISTKTTAGTPWDDGWHRVRVVRRVAGGTTEVYFDDMKTPAMTARDRTFAWGQVGVGSFDDTADWADVRVSGTRAEKPRPGGERPTLAPLFRTVDLNVGEAAEVELTGGKKVRVKLLDLEETHDDLRAAIRRAEVMVEVAGTKVSLVSANYRLPVTVGGVQIDCPVTKGYRLNSEKDDGGADPWGLVKDARLRLWPAGSPWMNPGTFVYPVKQRWFASGTQMANEPVHVDGGEDPRVKRIYYHYGLDVGATEGLAEVVSATDGLVVSAGKAVLPGYEDTPARPRYDVVYVLDARGWFYRYSHLHTISPEVKPGEKVRMGQRIGLVGKEGGSGGWSHLHFDVAGRQPSGRWGIVEGYAFLWEAYVREHHPPLLAVARPHALAAVGRKVVLDGSRSWSAGGKIASYEWTFGDGQTASGPTAERVYARPGVYSEVLKVTDGAGHSDYDFAVVNVLDPGHPDRLPPTIHAAYHPTLNLRPGDPVTFLVRTFRTREGKETWDFGDGSAPVEVRSDGNAVPLARDGYARTVHRFARPGTYLVRVERTDGRACTAVARLCVRIGPE